MKELGDQISKLKGPPSSYRGKGCKQCKQSGYLGRKGIYELLVVNDKLKRLISEKASSFAVREAARETAELISLREDGLLKVLKGITTREEIDRVAY